MTDPAELSQTTMYKIASLLWQFQGGVDFANLSLFDQDRYFKQAVRLFNEAEPVWRKRVGVDLTSAFFRGAEAMSDQVFEDHGLRVKPEFVSLYGEDEQEYQDWKMTHAG